MKIRNLAQNNLDSSKYQHEQVVGSLQAATALQITEGAQSVAKTSGLTSAQACTPFKHSDSLLYTYTLNYIQQCLRVDTAHNNSPGISQHWLPWTLLFQQDGDESTVTASQLYIANHALCGCMGNLRQLSDNWQYWRQAPSNL